ncbi:hypothetical protein EC973_003704 [Apophysomyces ossiformis]|uniref:F-box domain-containing protein n=1 Tax=Apophysomyces ossiformis TaxID=679940 RepID=A0A8H7BM70_9FUNG|nr:hypothetical protein EC973_003704 [Apophysomyces ossiformis]
MTDRMKRAFCTRHLPELVQTRSGEPYDQEELKKELDKVAPADRQPIAHVWSVFAAAAGPQRLLILQGLLSTCCSSQLSYLSAALPPLLRIDFTVILPPEICIQIFTYLDAQSLCAAAQVSRRWRRFADDDILWHRMCEQHIDRKCTRCGWGLPLMSKKRRFVRGEDETSLPHLHPHPSPSPPPPPPLTVAVVPSSIEPARKRLRPWKEIYSERLVIERNWRKNNGIRRVVLPHVRKEHRMIRCLQLCDIQNLLVVGLTDGTVLVHDLKTSQDRLLQEGDPAPRLARAINTLQFDETKLVTGSADHALRIWNYHTGQCIRTLRGHTAAVTHLHFDSRILLSGSADRTVRVWNFERAECYALHGHTETVNQVRIVTHTASSPTADDPYHQQHRHQVLSCSDDRTIRLWDLTQRTCVRVFQGHTGAVRAAIPSMPGFHHQFDPINPARPIVISGALDRTLRVWSLQEEESRSNSSSSSSSRTRAQSTCLQTLVGHTDGITALDYNNLRLVSASRDGVLKIWDVERGVTLHTIQAHAAPITTVALSDTKIISATEDAEIVIWDYGASNDKDHNVMLRA